MHFIKHLTTFFCAFILIYTVNAQVPSYVPSGGLLAWYPFSGNANDAGTFGHNGTVNGATLTTDHFNSAASAYQFNGSNNYISIPDNVNFRPQSFTASSWVYFNSVPANGTQMVLGKNVGSSTFETIGLFYYTQITSWAGSLGTPTSGANLNQSGTVSPATWYHFVYQYDAVNHRQLMYLNGSMTASTTTNFTLGYDTKPWYIGSELENGYNDFFFNGRIDDIGIWDRVLIPCEIQQLYLASAPITGVSSSTSMVCSGQTATLIASGAGSYTWFPGNTVSQALVVSPVVNTTYTVLSSLSASCQSSGTVALQVLSSPILTLVSSSPTLCNGASATLTASGVNTYTWSTLQGNAQIVVTPTVTGTETYTVSGTDANGCTGAATITEVARLCTGIRSQVAEPVSLRVYPNPNKGQFVIETTENCAIVIINTLGKIVYDQTVTSGSISINISQLPNGIYFVKAMNGNCQQTIKLIKE